MRPDVQTRTERPSEYRHEERAPFLLAFLLANWYSGATLLTLLLNKHPEIVSNGELFPGRVDGRVKTVTCSCGARVDTCAFYRKVASHMWKEGGYDPAVFRWVPELSENPYLQKALTTTRYIGPFKHRIRRSLPGIGSRTRQFLDAHEELIRKATQHLAGKWYLDGCKSLARAEMFLSESEYAQSPLILLVREPVSWCASWMSKRSAATVPDAIRTWTEYVRRSLKLAEAFPGSKLHVVRYEDLCDDPERELRHVFSFLDLDYDPRVLSVDASVEHHVLGNNMRLNFDGRVRAPRYRGDELTPSARTQILRSCGDLMDILGYRDP